MMPVIVPHRTAQKTLFEITWAPMSQYDAARNSPAEMNVE